MMKSVMNIRSTKKSWLVYVAGLMMIIILGLMYKNFNDKMTIMGESVTSYQKMIDKQSNHLRSLTQENERYKRDLKEEKEVNAGTMKEMESRLISLQEDCKAETKRLESDQETLQDQHNSLLEEKRKVENKYKTLSKANNNAIAEIENYKQENKKIRGQLHDATTSKSSELIQLRDTLAILSAERDKYKDQYSALFKQHQQSFDNIQMLQNEKNKLQDQIREIQKLSVETRVKSELSSQASELVQVQPDSENLPSSSSTPRAPSPVNQVMEEPAPVPSSSTASPSVEGEGQGHVLAAQPPPPAERIRYGRQQYGQPLQPQPAENQDIEFDSLNAPYERQIDYDSSAVQQPQVWPAKQQVRPQLVRHSDHYRLQQQRQQHYQPVGAWNNYQQNEIQDFYRQRGGQIRKDF